MTGKDLRIITGWTFLFIAFATVYAGGWLFALFISVLLMFGLKELLVLFRSKDLNPSPITAYLGSLSFIVLAALNAIQYFPLLAIFLTIISFIVILCRGKAGHIKDIGATLLTFVYAGLLPAHFLLIRNLETGTFNYCGFDVSLSLGLTIMVVVCVTGTDVFAYFAGCKFGKHKLWEAISPKKTIEGSLAGILSSIILALIVGTDIGLNLWQSIATGLIITVVAQLGDLAESMMKRDAGAKDASDILPGHGGLLDRADSYIFTLPVIYYFFYYFVVNPVF